MPMTWKKCYNASPDRYKSKPSKCEYCGLPVRQGKIAWTYVQHKHHRSVYMRKYGVYAYTHKKCQAAFRLTSRFQDDKVRFKQQEAAAEVEYLARFKPKERVIMRWRKYWYWLCRNIFPGYGFQHRSPSHTDFWGRSWYPD